MGDKRIPYPLEPEEMFQFTDDMMMYDWLRKNKPDGERIDELEARRNVIRNKNAGLSIGPDFGFRGIAFKEDKG